MVHRGMSMGATTFKQSDDEHLMEWMQQVHRRHDGEED